MRCGCKECGAYMVQHEQGLSSGCICPDCLSRCTSCTRTSEEPIQKCMLTTRLKVFDISNGLKIENCTGHRDYNEEN